MKKNLLFFISFLIGINLNAQRICHFDQKQEELLQSNPEYQKALDKMINDWSAYIENKSQFAGRPVLEGTDTIYEIPVVVHIFHTGQAIGHNYNKSDAQIQDWLNYTNAIFAGTAPGYVSTGSGGTKIPVRLVLAQRDTACNPTNGIVRINGSAIPGYSANGVKSDSEGTTGVHEDSLKNRSRWRVSDYYNIYIVHRIDGWDGYTAGSGVAGYAGFPTNPDYNYSTFMLSMTVSTADNTMAHEFGHSMGLYHTFQGSVSASTCLVETDCVTQGDRVCDTEIHPLVYTCPSATAINPCTGATYEGAQYNVMAYGSCPNRFTPGQMERAAFMLKTYRMSLLNSQGGLPPADPGEIVTLSDPTICKPSTIGYSDYPVGPTRVQLGDIDVASSTADDDGYYINYVAEVCQSQVAHTVVNSGEAVSLKIGILNINDHYIKAYIDYNNDGTFNEVNELVYNSVTAVSAAETESIVTIPFDGVVVNTPVRLRVIADVAPISSACSDRDYGQTEDYAITILDPMFESILSFDAITNNCNVNLNWKVGDIKEVHHFEVQKSIDGSRFETMQRVSAIQSENDYGIVDAVKTNGTLLYRLAVHTQNGKVQYSKLAKVETVCNSGFDIYPNPSDGLVKVKYLSQGKAMATLQVIDVTGKVIVNKQMEVTIGINEWQIELDNYASGAYIINVAAGNNSHRQVILKK